jgi:2-dehydropantoate 2-reductase
VSSLAIVGAGAIGSTIGWAAAEVGVKPTLCVRTGFDRVRITKDGQTSEVAVQTATDPDSVEPHDWVIIATKSQDTAGTADWMRGLIGPETVVVVVQNGIGHVDRVRPLVGDDTEILPAMIFQAAERTGPGEVSLHSDGRITVPAGPVGARFTELMAGSPVPAVEDSDFHTAAWRKLLSNVIANPITALTERRLDVMSEPDIVVLARQLLTEAIAVGTADGAHFAPDELERSARVYEQYVGTNGGGSSMLYDRVAGRPMEHEFITGPIVTLGEKYGVPTPVNRALLALLRAIKPS